MNTNTNIAVDVKDKVAGITRGSLSNDWVDCAFEIAAAPPGARGVVWKSVYKEKDTGFTRAFAGSAETRNHAVKVVCDVITMHIATTVEARKRANENTTTALAHYEAPGRFKVFWAFLRSVFRL